MLKSCVPHVKRRFVVDKPFWIIMREKDNHPYLVAHIVELADSQWLFLQLWISLNMSRYFIICIINKQVREMSGMRFKTFTQSYFLIKNNPKFIKSLGDRGQNVVFWSCLVGLLIYGNNKLGLPAKDKIWSYIIIIQTHLCMTAQFF